MRLPATPTTTLWRELRDEVRRQFPAGYLHDVEPWGAASVVVDNADPAHPRRIPGEVR